MTCYTPMAKKKILNYTQGTLLDAFLQIEKVNWLEKLIDLPPVWTSHQEKVLFPTLSDSLPLCYQTRKKKSSGHFYVLIFMSKTIVGTTPVIQNEMSNNRFPFPTVTKLTSQKCYYWNFILFYNHYNLIARRFSRHFISLMGVVCLIARWAHELFHSNLVITSLNITLSVSGHVGPLVHVSLVLIPQALLLSFLSTDELVKVGSVCSSYFLPNYIG